MPKFSLVQGPGVFEPIHGSAPDIAGQVGFTYASHFHLLKLHVL